MADGGQVNWFLDAVDDPLLPDAIPAFDGGQFSNVRANLLQPNQSKLLGNCDIDKLGKIRTRRGTELIGPLVDPRPDPSAATNGRPIQGLTSYQTEDANYIVAAHNGKIWKFDGGVWVRIATGGVADNDEIHVYREGKINHPYDPGPPIIEAGYTMGTTELNVDEVGYVGAVAPAAAGARVEIGEKLYFQNNLRSDWYEYTIAAVTPTVGAGGAVTKITLEEPGLVFDVKDNWKFTVARPARVNHASGYPGGYTGASIVIDEYVGVVNPNEWFVIKSENVRRKALTVSGTPTTQILTWTGANGSGAGTLEIDYVGHASDPVVFAQGQDMLFFSDGTGAIYGWNDGNLMNISKESTLDYLTGSTLHQDSTQPPQNVHILLWFQNRLIASGIPEEPDAIYFSDYFDGTSWDRNYQKVRIGGGESDPITGLLAWTDQNMIVFKKNSCYLVNCDPTQNPNPDDPTLLVASFAVKQLHKLIGCPAPNTAAQVGGGSTTPGSDIFFVDGDKKVHSIRRVMAAETQQEVGQAMSLPIQDVMDLTNRDEIDSAVAMYHNEHYILGIPATSGAGGGADGPNAVVSYNLLTQSWCGVWGWSPTCFARRTDLGAYSKLIFGDSTGVVQQWMDDVSLDEETTTTYMDRVFHDGTGGRDIPTTILTRAITFGDLYSYKTGLNVEFEFDESEAEEVVVQVILDKVPQVLPTRGLLAPAFDSLSERRLRLPFTIPATLPGSPDLLRKAFDLQRYGTWRELQFNITTTGGKLAIRSVRVTGFMDTMQLQTVPPTPPEPSITSYTLVGPGSGDFGSASDAFTVELVI